MELVLRFRKEIFIRESELIVLEFVFGGCCRYWFFLLLKFEKYKRYNSWLSWRLLLVFMAMFKGDRDVGEFGLIDIWFLLVLVR